MVFIGITPRKNAQCVTAMIFLGIEGFIFERAAKLTFVDTNFFPVTLEMTEQIVWPSEPSMT
ncbi:hypothetical protein QG37_03331 [Candidozyma auris]|uniref:Uncharacterized protein n=1 Tax=Candidozyma auris TaxID=498019 RepID=A0A0L0P0U9_CANAR|nr:hypothetical protein QG37_03331 [[Candida] auris]